MQFCINNDLYSIKIVFHTFDSGFFIVGIDLAYIVGQRGNDEDARFENVYQW
jgi:hypothetical protein